MRHEPQEKASQSPAAKEQFLYLTTTGRRSGLPRQIEIWFVQRGACYYVISERGQQAQWVRNILAHPQVRFRLGKSAHEGRARVIDAVREPQLAAAVQSLFAAKYGWSNGLIVELIPNYAASDSPH